jgi:hypothetical protein
MAPAESATRPVMDPFEAWASKAVSTKEFQTIKVPVSARVLKMGLAKVRNLTIGRVLLSIEHLVVVEVTNELLQNGVLGITFASNGLRLN